MVCEHCGRDDEDCYDEDEARWVFLVRQMARRERWGYYRWRRFRVRVAWLRAVWQERLRMRFRWIPRQGPPF
jgi:hypothetical protein